MDTAFDSVRQQLEAQLDHPGRLEVAAIKFALARLADGTYTECSKCGKEIDSRRLVAYPTTTTCLPCSI